MEYVVMSVGGSLLVPDHIDVGFCQTFREHILAYVKRGFRFALVCGGGQTARTYIESTQAVTSVKNKDIDWLGILATRMNAEMLRIVFGQHASPQVVYDPTAVVPGESIIIAGGYQPGWSTDYVATRLAHTLNVTRVINLSNIDAVYDCDPNTCTNARPLPDLTWSAYKKMVGSTWTPGMHAPFDPIASTFASEHKMDVIIAHGTDFNNLDSILTGKPFKGTHIR